MDTNNSKPIRVAAYCRVSTDKSDQANSLKSQQQYFEQYITNKPEWELIAIYADEGITGTSVAKRKAFQQMVAAAGKDFDLIITKEISRFARNTLDSIYYTRYLKSLGIGVIFLNDNINTLDPDAELRLTIMASIAQEESRKTSQRVKWGQKRRMEQGVVFGGSLLGYDVKQGIISVNEAGAKIVRLIFQKFTIEHKGTHVIARELQEANILTMHQKKWSAASVLRILRNEKYCGDLVQKKTYTPDYLSHTPRCNHGEETLVILTDHHQPIISRETFIAAAKLLDKRSLSQAQLSKHSSKYALSGKIRCEHCECNYVARSKKRKTSPRYIIWRCLNAVKHGRCLPDDLTSHGCPCSSLRDDDALDLLRRIFQDATIDRDSIIKKTMDIVTLVLQQDQLNHEPHKIEGKLDIINMKQDKLIDLYLDDKISDLEFQSTRDNYRYKKKELLDLLNSCHRQKNIKTETSGRLLTIRNELGAMLYGTSDADVFYGTIVKEITVSSQDHLAIHLQSCPNPWHFHKI